MSFDVHTQQTDDQSEEKKNCMQVIKLARVSRNQLMYDNNAKDDIMMLNLKKIHRRFYFTTKNFL